MKIKKTSLKQFLELSESPVFSKKTITGLLRSVLEPIAKNNPKCLIFTRLLSKEGIEGILRRVEYCQNVEMHAFSDIAKKNNLIELEFVLVTSGRYSALLVWDFSFSENKDSTQVFFLLNSSEINEAFEILQSNLKQDFSKHFYEFKPERRDNSLMNEAVFNIMELLNENVLENDFKEIATAHSMSESELSAYKESVTKNTREVFHEVSNQMGILGIYIKLLEKEFGAHKNFDIIKNSLDIALSRLYELKDFPQVSLEIKNIFQTLQKAVEMVRPLALERGNEISLTGKDLLGTIDEGRYVSSLINILKNASEATENDTIEVKLLEDGGFAKVTITNHGEKIQEPSKIFTSGYSTKDTLGVGLAITKKYLESQFSLLELTHSNDESTCFTVTTPISQGSIKNGFD